MIGPPAIPEEKELHAEHSSVISPYSVSVETCDGILQTPKACPNDCRDIRKRKKRMCRKRRGQTGYAHLSMDGMSWKNIHGLPRIILKTTPTYRTSTIIETQK